MIPLTPTEAGARGAKHASGPWVPRFHPPHELASSSAFPLRAGSRCAKGPYRPSNQDRCYANTDTGVFIVADGIGGHCGGEIASQALLSRMPEVLDHMLARGPLSFAEVRAGMMCALDSARQRMQEEAARADCLRRMGSTMVASIIIGRRAYVAHAGDCRAYHVRGETTTLLTRDQTVAQALIEAGATSSVARGPFGHVVTNWVGLDPLAEPLGMVALDLRPYDRLVLATDGLTGALEEKDIGRLARSGWPEQAADELVLEALHRGTRDNAACVVVKILPRHLRHVNIPIN